MMAADLRAGDGGGARGRLAGRLAGEREGSQLGKARGRAAVARQRRFVGRRVGRPQAGNAAARPSVGR